MSLAKLALLSFSSVLLLAGCDDFPVFDISVQVSDAVASNYSKEAPGRLYVQPKFGDGSQGVGVAVICGPEEAGKVFKYNLDYGDTCSQGEIIAWIEPEEVSGEEVKCGEETELGVYVSDGPSGDSPQAAQATDCADETVSIVIE